MTMHRQDILDLAEDTDYWVTDPSTMTVSQLLAQRALAQATVEDIGLQMQQDSAGESTRAAGWRPKAFRARRHYVAKVAAFEAEIRQRHTEEKLRTKEAVAAIHAEVQLTQNALFVRYILQDMAHEERAALWNDVRAAFPDSPAWDRVASP